jgi:hypothetical protein
MVAAPGAKAPRAGARDAGCIAMTVEPPLPHPDLLAAIRGCAATRAS